MSMHLQHATMCNHMQGCQSDCQRVVLEQRVLALSYSADLFHSTYIVMPGVYVEEEPG